MSHIVSSLERKRSLRPCSRVLGKFTAEMIWCWPSPTFCCKTPTRTACLDSSKFSPGQAARYTKTQRRMYGRFGERSVPYANTGVRTLPSMQKRLSSWFHLRSEGGESPPNPAHFSTDVRPTPPISTNFFFCLADTVSTLKPSCMRPSPAHPDSLQVRSNARQPMVPFHCCSQRSRLLLLRPQRRSTRPQ
jgi:hypothetical protein